MIRAILRLQKKPSKLFRQGSMIDYSQLRSALDNLERQWQNLMALPDRENITPLDTEGIEESVIKRFDIALEMTWKLLKKHLSEEVGLSDLPNGPKPILRIADQNHLLDENIEDWFAFVNARNNSSHDYSREKAQQTLALVEGFIQSSNSLYQRMTEPK